MKPTLAIFIHNPQCETACALGMIDGLVRDFDIRTFGLDQLIISFLREFDAVCFPGGMGNADDFDTIFDDMHKLAVQTYVAEGGKYFGICMGAYWAGSNYFDLVTDLTIGQYIERPDCEILTDGATVADVVFYGYKSETMYFYDGCAILGTDMTVIAQYQNGDAMAVIQGNVGLFGCHPEALAWWYTEGELDESWYTTHHAQIMRDFVHKLLAQ